MDKKDSKAQMDCRASVNEIAIISEAEKVAKEQRDSMRNMARRMRLRIVYKTTRNTTRDWPT